MNNQIDDRVTRLENTLYGLDGAQERGIVTRMVMVESSVTTINDAAKKIIWLLVGGIVVGLLNLLLTPRVQPGHPNNNSVSIGGKVSDAEPVSHKSYLTTEEVARKENKTARTIINWIEDGKIDPPPVKDGKSYQISENYRIIPKNSETFGNANSIEKDCKP